MFRRAFMRLSAALAAGGLMYSESRGQAAAVRKLAFVAGVSEYQKDGLTNLKYAEDDARDLAAELRKHGFSVLTVLGKKATLEKLTKDLSTFFNDTKKLSKEDVVLVALSGHGRQALQGIVEHPFFCPCDARYGDTETLLSLNWVMDRIKEDSASSQNLLLVDACRDNPARGGKGVDGSTVTKLPNKLSVLFSSSAGTQSYESDKIGHGLFTHFVLDGLRGKAADMDGEVTWLGLSSYVMKQVRKESPKLVEREQAPNLLGNLVRQPVLARVDIRKPPRPPVRPALLRAPFTATEAGQAQQAWADHLGVPRTKRDSSSGVTMVLIPSGEFSMGSSQAERDQMLQLFAELKPEYFADEKLHPVRITQPFYLSAHEVTVGQYRKFVTATGYKTEAEKDGEGGYGWNESEGKFEGRKPQYTWRNPGFSQTDDHPVVNVSWVDAVAFCDWVGGQDGGSYRLPREAEWEYACRAGTTTAFWNGDDVELVSTIGNLADASAKAKWINYPGFTYAKRSDGFVFTAPVGNYPSNAFGLYDMHGNVLEWCSDWYDKDYYGTSAAGGPDPTGPSGGSGRCVRGGSSLSTAWYARSAFRSWNDPSYRYFNLGFRVAASPMGPPASGANR